MATSDIEVRLALNAVGFQQGATKAKASVKDLGNELTQFKSLAAGALSFAGIGFGVAELVRAADQYGQMTARLRLATKASGDFEAVQQGLRRAAEETRAPLQDTVNLYSQIAPSLQGILNSQEIVGVITTVNQAIALSGSSAEASSAALVQFTQGLASGTLRGEELNSILEQTPALADALAEGLGVSRGQLRQLGSEGELTTERLVKALQKVSGRVASDFKDVPITVGQAFVLLNNSFQQFIGSLDQGTGTTSALANAIIAVSDGIDALSSSKDTLKAFTDVVIDGFDIGARVFRAFGTSIAATFAILERLLSLDVKGALEIYKQGWVDIAAIATEQLASNKIDQQSPQRQANARLQIETQLAEKIAQLEKLRSVAAGTASAEILKSDQALAAERNKVAADSVKERLRGEEALADALRKQSAESLKDAAKAREQAAGLRTSGADAATRLQDRAAERRNRGLSDQERSDIAQRDASNLTSRATLRAGDALAAARAGDLVKAASLAEEATKLAARAEKAADAIADDDSAARALDDLAKVQQRIAESQAQAKEAEAASLEQQAATQNELLAQAEQRIAALRVEMAKPVTLDLDIAEAEKKIAALRDQLAGVTGSAQAPTAAPGFSSGGYTGPGGKFQPAGIVHAGEFVLRQEVVRQRGMMQFLSGLNRDGVRALRGYASGGLVGNLAVPAVPGANSRSMQPADFHIEGLGVVPVEIERATADTLAKQLRRVALRAGRR